MRRLGPIILVALIAAGVVLFTTTTSRQQAAPEAAESVPLFPALAGDELRKALPDRPTDISLPLLEAARDRRLVDSVRLVPLVIGEAMVGQFVLPD